MAGQPTLTLPRRAGRGDWVLGLAGGLAAIDLIAGVAGFLFADRQEAAVGADADDGLGAAAFIDAKAVEFLAVAADELDRFDAAMALVVERVEDAARDVAQAHVDGDVAEFFAPAEIV